ncbi:MAG: MoaD/ThiS family protein [Candidatus Hydrothermarchaeota archaeon]|nr:MoaD/ThiS family protein [Candidatus Hydrothermarchaeota archaeon]
MAVVRLATPLRKFSEGRPEITAEGTTLQEVIDNVNAKSPGFADRILENGEIKRFVNIYVNNEDVRMGKGLATKIGKSDVISILPAVSGG